MAKPTFNKEDFQKGADSGGSFDAIPSGTYIATIAQTNSKITEKGARQAAIGFQIDSEDEKVPGQFCWWNQTTVNKDGNANLIGLNQYNQLLHKLSEGNFNVDELFNDEGELVNEENVLAKLEGTEARIKVIAKKDGEYTRYTITVQQVISSSYANSNGQTKAEKAVKEDNLESELDTEDVIGANVPGDPIDTDEDVEGELSVGDGVNWDDEKGNRVEGVITQLIEMDGKGMILIQPNSPKNAKPISKKPEEIFKDGPVESVDEIVEIEETMELKEGANAEYDLNGETHKGEVKKIDEDEGKVHFHVPHPNKPGKLALRKIDIAKVKVVM